MKVVTIASNPRTQFLKKRTRNEPPFFKNEIFGTIAFEITLPTWTSVLIFSVLPILLFYAAVSAQSERSLIRDGNRLYSNKKFADAEVNFRKALEKDREMKEGVFNLGDALYKQQRYDESAEQYRAAAEKTNDFHLKAEAYHNYGNALLKSKKYEESLGAYKEALKLNSKDEDTKYNYEYARQMLRQQQQEQQKKDQKDDKKKDDKQKQDQRKQDQQKQDQQKQDQQKQDQQKQDQQKQDQRQQQNQQRGQPKKQQISKKDAERILEALKNEDKDTQKKLHKKVPVRVKVEKDW